MSLAKTLEKIADELAAMAREGEINPSDIDLAATRIRMQVEMIELGLVQLEEAA